MPQMIPTLPAYPSVSLSFRDKAFIQRRRGSALAVRRVKVETALASLCVVVWTFNLAALLGGA
jgi:hypothetical protein